VNYYEHHLGDWAAATGHLSWDEDMAYTRLLRAYYHHEKAIAEGQQYRLAKASTPGQRRAVDQVLSEFFELRDGHYHQKRADAEIARYQDKQRKAKASADARWSQSGRNANASPDAMRTHSEGNAHHAPDTRHQSPDTEAKASAVGTPAGAICRALKTAGIANVNPGNLRLTTLLAAGATEAEFLAHADKARDKGDAFAYVLAAVEGERKRAAATAGQLHQGAMPSAPVTVPSNDAARTEALLREQREAAARAAPPPKDLLAKARAAVKVV
jgi:uncharacterized protein YdaU (DUF1376 family)